MINKYRIRVPCENYDPEHILYGDRLYFSPLLHNTKTSCLDYIIIFLAILDVWNIYPTYFLIFHFK